MLLLRFVGFFLGISLQVFSQEVQLNPVEITAERPSKIQLKHTEFSVKTDSLSLFPFAGNSLDKALNLAPATYIRDYGGAGALKTVSVRGFAANQSRLTLFDIPYKNIFSSVVNLANFSIDWLTKIDIRYFNPEDFQPVAPVVINLRPQFSARPYLSAEIGAFNSQKFSLNLSKNFSRVQIATHSLYSRSDNTFSYELNEEKGTRDPAPYTNFFQSFALQRKNFKNTWTLLGFATRNSLQIPPPVLKNNTTGIGEKTRQNDMFSLLQWEHRKSLFTTNSLSFKFHYSDLFYENKYFIANNYFSRTYGIYEKMQFHYGAFKFSGLYSLDYTFVSSNNLGIGFNRIPSVHRTEHLLSFSVLGKTNKHSFSLRTDYREISEFHGKLQGGIKYSYLTSEWQFSAYALKNYRFPSVSELYFIGFGNPDLLPEQAEQIVLFGSGNFSNFYVFCSPFFNRTRNKIIAVPIHPARWSVITLGFTQTYGAELGAEFRYASWQFYGSFTYQKAEDRSLTQGNLLPYTPEILWKNLLTWEKKAWTVSTQADFIGRRYVNLGNTDSLAAYVVINALVSYKISRGKFTYYLEISSDNLLNARYEIIRSYPMPSRSWRIRIRIYR